MQVLFDLFVCCCTNLSVRTGLMCSPIASNTCSTWQPFRTCAERYSMMTSADLGAWGDTVTPSIFQSEATWPTYSTESIRICIPWSNHRLPKCGYYYSKYYSRSIVSYEYYINCSIEQPTKSIVCAWHENRGISFYPIAVQCFLQISTR